NRVTLVGVTLTETGCGAVIVMFAVALFVASWTLVAFTENEPAVAPAVKSPEDETVPPVAVHVTALFDAFVTVAVNCRVPPAARVALVGEIVTPTDCGTVIVILAVAPLVGSCTLVAFTVNEPAVAPAV